MRIVFYLMTHKCPDETFFQTLLLNNSGLAMQGWDKRFYVWKDRSPNPETLGLDHLDAIRASEAWFTRKVDDVVHPELLDRLDDLLRG